MERDLEICAVSRNNMKSTLFSQFIGTQTWICLFKFRSLTQLVLYIVLCIMICSRVFLRRQYDPIRNRSAASVKQKPKSQERIRQHIAIISVLTEKNCRLSTKNKREPRLDPCPRNASLEFIDMTDWRALQHFGTIWSKGQSIIPCCNDVQRPKIVVARRTVWTPEE